MPILERFIRYSWAEYALNLATQTASPQVLRPWLEGQGLQGYSPHRTANTLANLWFPKNSNVLALRTQALTLMPALTPAERLALHWGMALVVFPSFRETVQVAGRLLRLQGEFSKHEVVRRVLERHSNQSTMKRAVERTLQSLQDWGVLKAHRSTYTRLVSQVITQSALASWLYSALLATDPEHHWRMDDLLRANEIFPFEVQNPVFIVHNTASFTIHRDAVGDETVGLKDWF